MEQKATLLFSKASICIHCISESCHDGPKPIHAPNGNAAFNSFETDMLSLSFQDDKPFRTHLITSNPAEIELEFLPSVQYSCEGRTTTFSRTKTMLPARVHISYTDFKTSSTRIWHFVITPTKGETFNEHDLIQISKLYTGQFEETVPPPEESISFTYKSSTHNSISNLLCYLVTNQPSQAQKLKIIGGTIQASCASLSTSSGDWKNVISSIKSCHSGDYNSCLKLENQLDSDDYLKSQLMAWCGVIAGIYDYNHMVFGELLDTLRPTVPGIGELINVHRSNLVCLSPEDDLLDRCWNNIGISPYLLIPHALILHNEVLISKANKNLYEILNGKLNIKSMEKLQDERKTIEELVSVKSLPNVFHYECEKSLFDQGLKSRGFFEKLSATQKMQNELVSRIEDSKRKSDKKYAFWLSVIMAFLSGLATHSVLHELATDIDQSAPILEWYFFIPVLMFIVGASAIIAYFIRRFT